MPTNDAGRALDAEIAERVLGLVPCSNPSGRCVGAATVPIQCWGTGGPGSEIPSYSTDVPSAMDLLDDWKHDWEIRRQHGLYVVTLSRPSAAPDATVERLVQPSESLPLAIAYARLRAVDWISSPPVSACACRSKDGNHHQHCPLDPDYEPMSYGLSE